MAESKMTQREPTAEMLAAGREPIWRFTPDYAPIGGDPDATNPDSAETVAKKTWQAMYDAADSDAGRDRAKLSAALSDELIAAAKWFLFANPVFRSKPVGGDGSPARIAQSEAIAAENALRTILAKVDAP